MSSPDESLETAVFGGSFDPPHLGHVEAARYAVSRGGFVELLVIPVFAHAFDKAPAPFDHRVRMAELAFEGLPRVRVSRIEERLGAPSRSLRTVEALLAENPFGRLRLVVGSDVLGETSAWYRWDELVQKAPPFVLGRAGSPRAGIEPSGLPEVSSTEVRELLRSSPGPRATNGALLARVPRAVLEYLDAEGLYR